MSPHAISSSSDASPYQTSVQSMEDDIPGLIESKRSNLSRFDGDEVHDLVGVGFGPASLAIAVALHDSLEASSGSRSASGTPKVRFLERQSRFRWHAGMLLPGAKMQITFLKDMATLRNPRSNFTFLNYLYDKNRLVAFTNLNTFLPQRAEYEDYMRWCAEHFADVVEYGQTVEHVEAGKVNPATGEVEYFHVTSIDHVTGERLTLKARHVVISAGGRPNIPKQLQANHPRVIHSSQYLTHVHDIFPAGSRPQTVAVVGAGQSAAECWHDIPVRFPGAQSLLIMKGAALKPSDDSPFVNEIFNPERVDAIFSRDPLQRAEAVAADKATNYGVVRLELIEKIYDEMYSYKLQYHSEQEWPHRILSHRSVSGMRDVSVDGKAAVELQIESGAGLHGSQQETVTVDLVIVATGYVRDSHETLLAGLRGLMPDDGAAQGKKWKVGRDYAVEFAPKTVSRSAGIWLQGCNEKTHGLSDTLLSILAVRGGEMVENIFGKSSQSQPPKSARSVELR